MIIQVCVGSSCHIKGSPVIVELLQKAVEEYHLENEVTLADTKTTDKRNLVFKMMIFYGFLQEFNNLGRPLDMT